MTDTSSIRRTDFKQAAYDAAKRYKGSLDMIENAMTDYNDGNWHGWDGGECPVHPNSLIEIRTPGGYHETDRRAGITAWADPKLFRVTKPYVEPPKPREFWANEYAWGFSYLNDSKAKADENATEARIRCIHVREVIEE